MGGRGRTEAERTGREKDRETETQTETGRTERQKAEDSREADWRTHSDTESDGSAAPFAPVLHDALMLFFHTIIYAALSVSHHAQRGGRGGGGGCTVC